MTKPKAKKVPKDVSATEPPEVVVLRYVGDGSVFQSNIPNRDVTESDRLSDELLELAVATGTHTRA